MDEQNKIKLNNDAQTIHTYAGDMASMVRENEASVIKIAMAEQRRREKEIQKDITTKQKNRSILFVILAVILIVGSFFVVKFLNEKGKIEATHPEIITEVPTLIPSDGQTTIKADSIAGREDLVRAITEQKNKTVNIKLETLALSTSGQKLITAEEFLDKMGSSIPSAFKRSLDSKIMIGVNRANTGVAIGTFFIFKFNSYEQAVAGAYAWEKTLLDEFSTMFGIDISGENRILLQKSFEDEIVYNTDIRVLKNLNNESIIYSTFLSPELYMISDNAEIITEAIKRIRTQNAKPL